ncbi:MAG: helix-turn-helix domain containing protein [Sulfurimonas sp.]|nr:helix-turn-helix domain containing protein [Sulfurimonas sp.]
MTKKELIIQTAQKLFAQNGYDATSIDDIAKPCEVTKAAIYYHFKDKHELYEEILQTNIKLLADRVEAKVALADGPEKKLYAYVMTFAQELDTNRNIASMLMREMSNGGKNMPLLALSQMLRTFKLLTSIIEVGVKEKIFQCMEPMLIQMMIVGSFTFVIQTQGMRHKIKEELDTEAKTEANYPIQKAAEKIANMILHSLTHGEN